MKPSELQQPSPAAPDSAEKYKTDETKTKPVIILNPVLMSLDSMGHMGLDPGSRNRVEENKTFACPKCHEHRSAVMRREVGRGAYILGAGIALIGGILGCCLIPCYSERCKDMVLKCSNCQTELKRTRFLLD